MTNISNITGKYDQAFLSEAADKQRVDTPAAPPVATEATETERPQDDRVSLSGASRDMQTAKEAVAATPDVREEKVSAIKQAVESGRYEVNAGKVAEKMVGLMIDQMI